MKIRLSENKLRTIIKECINDILFESQGVVERGYDQFAEYLWDCCVNSSGDVEFTVSGSQWEKFNVYGLGVNEMDISISDSVRGKKTVSCSFGSWPIKPTLFISRKLIESGKDNFIRAIMHELVHSVNKLSGVKSDERKSNDSMDAKIRRKSSKVHSIPGGIQYMFTPTEMSARITEAYYWLRGKADYYREAFSKSNDKQSLVDTIFNDIENITHYKKMVKFTDIVSQDEYGKDGVRMYDVDTPKGTSILPHLGFDKSFKRGEFNDEISFSNHKERVLKYMQAECESFKKRIYKMIYKFISDFNIIYKK